VLLDETHVVSSSQVEVQFIDWQVNEPLLVGSDILKLTHQAEVDSHATEGLVGVFEGGAQIVGFAEDYGRFVDTHFSASQCLQTLQELFLERHYFLDQVVVILRFGGSLNEGNRSHHLGYRLVLPDGVLA